MTIYGKKNTKKNGFLVIMKTEQNWSTFNFSHKNIKINCLYAYIPFFKKNPPYTDNKNQKHKIN